MCKKALIALFLVVISFFTSCVDNNYDLLNKQISTDVNLKGNTIALPIGSLKAILLDSLIDVNEIEMLEKDTDGVYSIAMDSVISIEMELDSITLDVKPFEYNASINFDSVNIKNVRIKAEKLEPATFSAPKITIEDLNNHLPKLESSVSPGLDVANLLAQMEKFEGDVCSYQLPEPLRVDTTEQVDCNVNYTLSTDIETVESIKLGSEADSKGTLVSVVVTNPSGLSGNEKCLREIDFRIDFPEIFVLAKNENADQADKYTLENENHSISLKGLVPSDEETNLSFYITEIVGVKDYIKDGVINIAKEIEYSIGYQLDGVIDLTKDMTAADFVFDVKLDAELSLKEVAGTTKDVRVAFDPIEMTFDGEFDNLKHIEKICYVDFVETESKIKFNTKMDNSWLEAFELKDGYALRISFPESLKIDPELSLYKGEYKEDEHAFYVYEFNDLEDFSWELALDRIDLDLTIDKEQGKCNMVETAIAEIVDLNNPDSTGIFLLEGCYMDNMVATLGKLGEGDKKAEFSLLESNLVIENAVVQTDGISSSLDAKKIFKINEEIPTEIKRINSIDFEEPVAVAMALNIAGLDDLDAEIYLDVNISLPPYLQLQSLDGTDSVSVDNGELKIKKNYKTGKPLELELLCTGINFADEGIACDGYISDEYEIVVDGEASIKGTEIQSKVLDNDISFNIDFDIKKIVVRAFHGIYNAEIEGVAETIALDLGEELEFLKDPNNSITLAEPQLELVLKNPVGIPVDVDLHLFGTDETGVMIAESEIETKVSILPAVYDKAKDELIPVETKLFITSDTSMHKKSGYNNIEIKNLANLLKTFPDSLNLMINPEVQTDVTHHVNISDSIKLDVAYSVIVPLKFKDLQLCYNDTITNLDSNLGETMEMFSNVALNVRMDIVNTMPLGLSLKIVPLDVSGLVIDDIEIDELAIAAGSGEALVGEDGTVSDSLQPQKFEFAIKSKSGDISSLDGLAFSVKAAADHTTGAAALKGEQGIKISNIVFEVSGDIETDFGK